MPTVWHEWQDVPTGPWQGVAPLAMEVSADCEAAVAEAFSLDWESFGSTPSNLPPPASVIDLTISALVTLVSANFGMTEELQAALSPDELLSQEYPGGLPTEAPGHWNTTGVFLFSYVRARVNSIAWVPDTGCVLRYVDGGVRVCVQDYVFIDPEERTHLFPPALAAGIVHEAGHAHGPAHMGNLGLDEDCNGSYGLEARFLAQWLDASAALASELDIAAGERALEDACDHIRARSDSCPCPD